MANPVLTHMSTSASWPSSELLSGRAGSGPRQIIWRGPLRPTLIAVGNQFGNLFDGIEFYQSTLPSKKEELR
jgi:hypothetical protein